MPARSGGVWVAVATAATYSPSQLGRTSTGNVGTSRYPEGWAAPSRGDRGGGGGSPSSPPPRPAPRVGVGVGQTDAQVDHPPPAGGVGDQLGVVAGVGNCGDGLDQGVEEGAAAHVRQLAAVVELPEHGDRVGGLAPVGQAQDGPPDGAMGGPVEVGLLEQGGDLDQQPPGGQDRAQDGLLGLQVVGRLRARVPGAAGPGGCACRAQPWSSPPPSRRGAGGRPSGPGRRPGAHSGSRPARTPDPGAHRRRVAGGHAGVADGGAEHPDRGLVGGHLQLAGGAAGLAAAGAGQRRLGPRGSGPVIRRSPPPSRGWVAVDGEVDADQLAAAVGVGAALVLDVEAGVRRSRWLAAAHSAGVPAGAASSGFSWSVGGAAPPPLVVQRVRRRPLACWRVAAVQSSRICCT